MRPRNHSRRALLSFSFGSRIMEGGISFVPNLQIFGKVVLGSVRTSCPHMSSENPRNTHQSHSSHPRPLTWNALPVNSMISIYKGKHSINFFMVVLLPHCLTLTELTQLSKWKCSYAENLVRLGGDHTIPTIIKEWINWGGGGVGWSMF